MGNSGKSEPATSAKHETPAKPAIKAILADSQAIYRMGIRKIFALEDDIRVVAQCETLGQLFASLAKNQADIILFETAISSNPAEAVSEVMRRSPASKVIVLTVAADEDDTVDYLRRGVRGIVTRSVNPELLVRCVRKVFEGETWLDNKGVNWVIDAYRSQASQLTNPRPKAKLSDKEMLIISCVTQGMRNKEIAGEIGTTEQVVKNYLRKVYDKLGVSDRLELALYCIHHQLLKRNNKPEQAADASTALSAGAGT